MTELYYDYLESDIGALLLMATDKGLRAVYHDQSSDACSLENATHERSLMAPYIKTLQAYLRGELKEFTLSLDPAEGTELQGTVWRELRRVPYGETITYSWDELQSIDGKIPFEWGKAASQAINPIQGIIGGFTGD